MDVTHHPRGTLTVDGNCTARSPYQFPYSYDPFVVWTAVRCPAANASIYTDRIRTWNAQSYERLIEEVFPGLGHYWCEYEPAAVQDFLCRFLDCRELQVERLVEHCNHANGYPCWQILYFDPRKVSQCP